MPITLPPLSRRRFLASVVAGSATWLAHGSSAHASARDANRFALLSDTHIAGDRAKVARGVNMHDNLQKVVGEILAAQSAPAGALIAGDLAFNNGTLEDYAVLVERLQPLRQQGVPVHLALGNHDHRERFWEALGEEERKASELPQKHVLVVSAPLVNWFVLDSLDRTDKVAGELGEQQLKWLAEALDRAADKPALVMLHHYPDKSSVSTGLVDTERLLEVLLPRRHVKAWIYGHSHVWKVDQREGLHLVNLPAAAYVFAASIPNGWVDAQVAADGMTLELRCLDPQHAQHAQRMELKWRT
ncbi:MAG: phosphohydrolase [Candidatus Anammoximicrobium sp.]|nr:phosphohydrolase [Candidatus Anammoximicrobium sp.]